LRGQDKGRGQQGCVAAATRLLLLHYARRNRKSNVSRSSKYKLYLSLRSTINCNQSYWTTKEYYVRLDIWMYPLWYAVYHG